MQVKLLRAHPGVGVRAGRRHQDHQGRRPPDHRHQPRPRAARSSAGNFREDLFYRLNVVPLHIPPLRERARRHPAAGRALHRQVQRAAEEERARHLRRGDRALLKLHTWPGNIRELENVLERTILFCHRRQHRASATCRPTCAARRTARPRPLPTTQRDRGAGGGGRRRSRAREPTGPTSLKDDGAGRDQPRRARAHRHARSTRPAATSPRRPSCSRSAARACR